MSKPLFLIPIIIGLGLSGCAVPHHAVSNPPTAFSFQATGQDGAVLIEQTAALDRMMKDIVRNTTIKHAAVGAAVGCGLAIVTSNASHCLAAAASGGVVGAVNGHMAGKKDVARRMELVSANAIVRSIRTSNAQLDDISIQLPSFLARQESDIEGLAALRGAGTLTEAEYEARLDAIRASRAELAEALMMSSQQARLASANLRAAAAQGQSGLEWHISAVEQMERETVSARSQISLL
ncbi:hypothetical protein [Sulfitobacter sp. HGT1]|uniref:hypothetical protein n=1 Tax=Sulfitobacter sp. HGT1 TaxID=2735435 RepID=UPI0015934E59|nr:hypothetical protein [Sulfitobacter sp. HGT1]MBQ0804111.1 hypothetical protein [Sulfitobacter sp.]